MLFRSYLTIQALHESYKKEHPDGYGYTQFKKSIRCLLYTSSDISEDLLLDFRKYRLLAKKKATTVNKTLWPILQACEYACQ